MPYEASCVAEFQDQCAEEEGDGGPEGHDAEACHGVSGRLCTPIVAWASRPAGRGPIWSRCRVRAGLETTAAAIGNRYSTPSTRPMAAAESRTVAASPRLSRAMSVRYKTAPAAARRAVGGGRGGDPGAGGEARA